MRCNKWWHMIKVSIILVISKNEDRLFPNLGIFCQYIHHFANVPGTVPGRRWMIREIFRSNQPGYSGELATLNVFTELMKHITFGNFYFSFFIAIFIFYRSELVIKWIIAVCNKCFLMNIFFVF